jgi:MFS transporter, AAHS family, benzoate transport protein
VIPGMGWRAMFVLGGMFGLVLLPVLWKALPESASYLLARGRESDAESLAATYQLALERPDASLRTEKPSALSGLKALFASRFVLSTLLFWVGTGMGLLLVYGLNTWLAQIMATAGYELGSALAFLLVLNLGAIVGTPLLGAVADRLGSKQTTTSMFLTAGLCIFLLSYDLPSLVLYVLVAIAGACTIGTTILVNAYTANYYPAHMRATGLGWALGVGRLGAIMGPIYGAFILDSGWGLDANFYAFAIPALVGAVAMFAIPTPASVPETQPATV